MKKRYFLSTVSGILGQIVGIICGVILPRVMIERYGSEVYGATTSIAQFLGYIMLLEAGIGGVARAALYKPIAENDIVGISKVLSYVQKFFRTIAYVFAGYTFVLALAYKYIAKDTALDWWTSFLLVIVISVSTMAQYYFGITKSTLLQADQRTYVNNFLNTSTQFINTIISCVMAYSGAGIIALKIATCIIHIARIIVLNIYVSKNYQLQTLKPEKDYLPQKKDALGQHLAYVLHSHTDVIVLTLFVNLKEVSVYSIYNYICSSLATLTLSFNANMESISGKIYATGDTNGLQKHFRHMQFILHTVVSVFFSVAAVLILPFINIYTAGLEDANYYRPSVAYLMLFSQFLWCIRTQYGNMLVMAGHFKQQNKVAYMECILNVGLSIVLVGKYGMEGIIFATIVSILYRGIFYIIYLRKNILFLNVSASIKRIGITILSCGINILLLNMVLKVFNIPTFFEWVVVAIVSVVIATFTSVIIATLTCKEEMKKFYGQLFNMLKGIKKRC